MTGKLEAADKSSIDEKKYGWESCMDPVVEVNLRNLYLNPALEVVLLVFEKIGIFTIFRHVIEYK